MNKTTLEKLEKWHSLCALKGVDIEDESYSIHEVLDTIDQLDEYIRNNEKFYQVAISLKQMGLTADNLTGYEEHLSEQWHQREKQRRVDDETNNSSLREIREKYKFKDPETNYNVSKTDFNTSVTLKNGIVVKIEVEDISHYHHTWKIEYKWYDKGLDTWKISYWSPRKSSIKSPKWFPDHWKTNEISDARHMAYYVAWKLVNGRASSMGMVPLHTKRTTSMTAVDDVKNIIKGTVNA
jgi:hypothetical protein